MPRIKLLKKNGSHSVMGMNYEAGQEYEVDHQTAHHLVVQTKVAEEVGKPNHKDSTDHTQAPINPFKDDGRLKIALIRLGGIGDSLLLSILATGVRRKYPHSHITLFVRDRGGYDVVQAHPCVDQIVLTGNIIWKDFSEKTYDKDYYDIIYDCRYATKIFYKREHINIKNGRFINEKKITDKLFEPFQELFDCFPLACNKVCNNAGMDEIEMTCQSAGVDAGVADLKIMLKKEDLAMLPLIDSDKYVTFHNGADIARQTKCWSTKKWKVVIDGLKANNFKVIQLGGRFEEIVEGAIDMTGKTTLTQCAGIISKALFHIDTEGGLVHMARAVKTRSIVLFGPTPTSFFAYDDNINLEPTTDCKGCWWTTDFWWRECPKGYPLPPKCMESISPNQVCVAIKEILKMSPLEDPIDMNNINEQFAVDLILNEKHYKSNPHQLDRIETMMAKCKGKTVLEVGAGDGYCVEVLIRRGFKVTATEVSKIRIKRMQGIGIDAIEADVRKLPFEDNSFDTVMCGEVLEHIPSMADGLKELERVCKPDGIIIVSLPVADRYRPMNMHLWGISQHQVLFDGKSDLLVLGFEQINRDKTAKDGWH